MSHAQADFAWQDEVALRGRLVHLLVVAVNPELSSVMRVMVDWLQIHDVRSLALVVIHRPEAIATPRYGPYERHALHVRIVYRFGSARVALADRVTTMFPLIFQVV